MPKHRLIISRKSEAFTSSDTWLRFIDDPGDGGVTSTFAGGEPAVRPRFIVDLSAAASTLLGQQVAQSATYRLRGMTIGFSPKEEAVVNLTSVNNESDSAFNGRVLWYGDTDHGRRALTLARTMERNQEDHQLDGDSFLLGTDRDYTAVRFGMSDDDDVIYQTEAGGMLQPVYGKSQWNLATVMQAYDAMTAPDQNNALFNGRGPGRNSFGWVCSQTSGKTNAGNGGWITPHWHQQDLLHDVLAGLLEIQILGSTMAGGEGTLQDDWHTEITVDFEVVV